MVNIAVLVSGSGTNLQALIDAQGTVLRSGKITLVVSSKPGVFALQRAANAGIASIVLRRGDFASPAECDEALLSALKGADIGLVVLAGYLSILGPAVTKEYHNRILNVHPSLIPAFCGDGFYGLRVHKAALERGVRVTGATVHFVNEVTDGGPIVLQKAVEILEDDTPETLQKRVMQQAEWELLPRAAALYCDGRLLTEGSRVRILPEKQNTL